MSEFDWITHLTAPQRTVFLDSLRAALTARGLPVRMEDGVVVLSGVALALAELAAACATVQPADYGALLGERLDTVLLGIEGQTTAAALDSDWPAAQRHIKLRLFPAAQAVANEEILVSADIGAGLSVVLVYDLPDSVTSVQPDAVAAWPVTGAELWRIATANLRAEEPPPVVERIALTEDADALLVTGESYFVASRLLILGDILPPSSFPYGALVIVPHRHAMVVHPITGSEIYDALTTLSVMAGEMVGDSPGPMSSAVYWWKSDAIEEVAVVVDEDAAEVTVEPSVEFGELLDWLLKGEE
jgi:hypothetical protein